MVRVLICCGGPTIFGHLKKACNIYKKCFKTTLKATYVLPCRVIHERHKSTSLTRDSIRIGCASGFWGDTVTAVPQLIHNGRIDFLVSDYLSEITMSLLAAARKKNPDLGYAPDFVQFAMGPFLKDIKSKGIKVVSNAGGINPLSCSSALKAAASKAGVDLKIATILGDDLMPQKEYLQKKGIKDMHSSAPLPENIHTMNAYLGAAPIAQALDLGADIVVTGRCVDSALVLGPLLHMFQWQLTDWDKLAAGSLAGHLLECGAQSTGGIFTDWHIVSNWENIGFPIAECSASGAFLITKPENTGGLVSCATVAEQMLYEVHDPSNYILPDVTCDFSEVTLNEDKGGVLVKGAKGKPCPDDYKVSATYADGFRATVVVPIIGPKAAEKGQKTVDAILKRCNNIFKAMKMDGFTSTCVQMLGSGAVYGHQAKPTEKDCREAVIWLAVQHKDDRALKIFSREVAPAATGMAPGLTTIVGGRPKPSPVLKLFSFLHPREQIQPEIWMDGEKISPAIEQVKPAGKTIVHGMATELSTDKQSVSILKGINSYRLQDLAYTRSGDKGNTANIAVISRNPKYFPYLKATLTEAAVAKYFEHMFDKNSNSTKKVSRYEVPGINALNFVLYDCLGGGGIASLRCDPQGKALGQMLLDFEINDMPKLAELMQG